MINFTGWQWLLIDAANQYGHDKLRFEERIQWTEENLPSLEALADQAEIQPLYLKAVMAIRKAQQGIPTGHMVGVDGVCSGIQIMSAVTGCIAGADATGLIDSDRRADAYSSVTNAMNGILGGGLVVSRKDAKDATITAFYGSKRTPMNIFGEGTPELAAFYEAGQQVAPGAWDLLQVLLNSWQPWTLVHAWKLPDGYDARIKVMKRVESRIEIDELNHATFTHEHYINRGVSKGLSNAANVTHSLDAYVLRSMHRRCNYDREVALKACQLIQIELIERSLGQQANILTHFDSSKFCYYVQQYNRSNLADVVILPYLTMKNLRHLENKHLESLASILYGMLQYEPFELVTVHDEFKAHPNNINWVRYQYKEILAELAESNVLNDILSQIYGTPWVFHKRSNNLGELIRKSNYALC